jgi:hypothetical protein
MRSPARPSLLIVVVPILLAVLTIFLLWKGFALLGGLGT